MSDMIIERGRGPEITGTRITIYVIHEYAEAGFSVSEMCEYLGLMPGQVQAALDYITLHRAEVEAEYQKIVVRTQQGNPAWVDALLAKSPEELKQRIRKRMRAVGHAPSGRQ